MTFFVVTAGASATLVGLLFVAVQIGPPLVEQGHVGPRHAIARSTFTVFAIIFMLSLLFLVPHVPIRFRAQAAIVAAVLGAVRAVRTWVPVWRDKLAGRIEIRIWQTVWLLVGPEVTYVMLAIGGIKQLAASNERTLEVNVAFVFTILFVIGLRNSWNLLVEATATS